jgi:hypothetical protein
MAVGPFHRNASRIKDVDRATVVSARLRQRIARTTGNSTAGIADSHMNEQEFTMLNVHRRFVLAVVVSILILPMSGTGAAQSLKRTALWGYDPVSYFTPGQPERGSKEFTAAFDDAMYQFKSAEHRDTFIADPVHYAPQYRGYCAVAMSKGRQVEANPQAWLILNGKLYVFANVDGPAFARANPAVLETANANWSAQPKIR